jgi:hypothetical protein
MLLRKIHTDKNLANMLTKVVPNIGEKEKKRFFSLVQDTHLQRDKSGVSLGEILDATTKEN